MRGYAHFSLDRLHATVREFQAMRDTGRDAGGGPVSWFGRQVLEAELLELAEELRRREAGKAETG